VSDIVFHKVVAEISATYSDTLQLVVGISQLSQMIENHVKKSKNVRLDSGISFGDGPPNNEESNVLHRTTWRKLKASSKENSPLRQRLYRQGIVMLYSSWDQVFRKEINDYYDFEVKSDAWGDLRLLRNAIIHNEGILDKELKRIKGLPEGKRLSFNSRKFLEICQELNSDTNDIAKSLEANWIAMPLITKARDLNAEMKRKGNKVKGDLHMHIK